MFCPNCGNQNEDGLAFCQYCGTQLGDVQPQNQQVNNQQQMYSQQAVYNQQQFVPQPTRAKSSVDVKALWRKYKKYVFIGVGALVAILALIIFLVSRPTGVNVKDYMEIEVTGYNAHGELTWDFDYDEFFDAATKGKYTAKLKNQSGSSSSSLSGMLKDLNKASELYIKYQTAYEAIEDALEIEVEYPDGKNNSNLSNEDVVTFNFTCDKKVASEYGFKLSKKKYEYKVANLKEADTFDVLQYFDVTFSGLDGEGEAKIVSKSGTEKKGNIEFRIEEDSSSVYCVNEDTGYSSRFYVSVDQNSALSSGAVVTLKADVNENDYAEAGVILTNLTKQYTVGTLGRYVSSLSEIEITELIDQRKVSLMDWIYDDWGEAVHDSWRTYTDQKVCNDMTLYKIFLTTPKSNSASTHNTLWLVYTVKLNDDQLKSPTDYYFAIKFDNVGVDGDGALLGNLHDGEWREDFYGTRYNGTQDYNKFYNDNIATFKVNVEAGK